MRVELIPLFGLGLPAKVARQPHAPGEITQIPIPLCHSPPIAAEGEGEKPNDFKGIPLPCHPVRQGVILGGFGIDNVAGQPHFREATFRRSSF